MHHLCTTLYLLGEFASKDVARVLGWSMALVASLIVGLAVISRLKRKLQQPDEPTSAGFSLSDLRALHRGGQMTDEEFERAKLRVVEAARRAAERDDPLKRRRTVAGGLGDSKPPGGDK